MALLTKISRSAVVSEQVCLQQPFKLSETDVPIPRLFIYQKDHQKVDTFVNSFLISVKCQIQICISDFVSLASWTKLIITETITASRNIPHNLKCLSHSVSSMRVCDLNEASAWLSVDDVSADISMLLLSCRSLRGRGRINPEQWRASSNASIQHLPNSRWVPTSFTTKLQTILWSKSNRINTVYYYNATERCEHKWNEDIKSSTLVTTTPYKNYGKGRNDQSINQSIYIAP